MIIPLMTNKNKPKVKSVTGMVRMRRIGFRKVFKKDKTKATIKAAGTPEILTPDNNSAVMSTDRADTSILTNQFFMFRNCFLK
jgi:hypothetical protein